MAEIKFYKALNLPTSPTSAHDGVWFVQEGANSYKHYVISGGNVHELFISKEYSGTANPNEVTPPDFDYSIPSYYKRLAGTDVVELWVYTGISGWVNINTLNGLSTLVSYDAQTPTLSQQAQARENLGLVGSWYDQVWIYNETINTSKEFTLDFTPTQIVQVSVEGTLIFFDNDDYEYTTDLEPNKLKINVPLIDGQKVRILYYHK